MKNRIFDCVEMKRRGAERVVVETAGMTPEQELEYWRTATEELLREQRELRVKSSSQRTAPQPA
jgi:hypothetical protein